jgi:hypothetical protein
MNEYLDELTTENEILLKQNKTGIHKVQNSNFILFVLYIQTKGLLEDKYKCYNLIYFNDEKSS